MCDILSKICCFLLICKVHFDLIKDEIQKKSNSRLYEFYFSYYFSLKMGIDLG